MSLHLSRRRLLALTAASVIPSAAGCGTFMHPERRGQPAGDIDWKVVALNSLGLLLFFIPGIIAFAVDFSTGAIYLPPTYLRLPPPNVPQPLSDNSAQERELVTVNVPPERMSYETVEQVVSNHTGREVRLKPGTYQTEKLRTIKDFWASADKFWRPWKRS